MAEGECAASLLHIEDFRNSQLKAMAEMRKSGVMTDVMLTAGGGGCGGEGSVQVQAHRIVLASTSDYFRTMFKECWTCQHPQLSAAAAAGEQQVLEILDISANVLSSVVDYFYTGELLINGDNVGDLLNVGSLLLMPKLIEACVKGLFKNHAHT